MLPLSCCPKTTSQNSSLHQDYSRPQQNRPGDETPVTSSALRQQGHCAFRKALSPPYLFPWSIILSPYVCQSLLLWVFLPRSQSNGHEQTFETYPCPHEPSNSSMKKQGRLLHEGSYRSKHTRVQMYMGTCMFTHLQMQKNVRSSWRCVLCSEIMFE